MIGGLSLDNATSLLVGTLDLTRLRVSRFLAARRRISKKDMAVKTTEGHEFTASLVSTFWTVFAKIHDRVFSQDRTSSVV